MIKIGIICPSEIALRRFMPSLLKSSEFVYSGVAFASINEWDNATTDMINNEKLKAEHFQENYGGQIFDSYQSLINSNFDAIYIPLPPALHYKWAKKALQAGKHVLLEKPFTLAANTTNDLINEAEIRGLALHENYMFAFHDQLEVINEIIDNEIGALRLYRISFGFPKRDANDFRYNKKLGGGALFDCGGYTLKYATMLLGDSTKLVSCIQNYSNDIEVDLFGSATLVNDKGQVAQIAFGMDNSYRCELDVWGNTGSLFSGRVLTAPDGFTPEVLIKTGTNTIQKKLPSDDSFYKSIEHFFKCINDSNSRNHNYKLIQKQADLVDEFIKLSK